MEWGSWNGAKAPNDSEAPLLESIVTALVDIWGLTPSLFERKAGQKCDFRARHPPSWGGHARQASWITFLRLSPHLPQGHLVLKLIPLSLMLGCIEHRVIHLPLVAVLCLLDDSPQSCSELSNLREAS